VGLFFHQEFIAFVIGRSHVSDRLSRPHTNKHVIREEEILQEGGEDNVNKDYEGT